MSEGPVSQEGSFELVGAGDVGMVMEMGVVGADGCCCCCCWRWRDLEASLGILVLFCCGTGRVVQEREREREVFKTAPASGRSDIYALGTGGDIRVSGGGAE